MDLAEAQARFQALEGQLAARQIDINQYRAALNQLRVVDAQGRTWMPQERTGVWHYWNGQVWAPGTPPPPPGYAPAGYQAAPMPGYRAAPAPQPAPARRRGSTGVYILFWLVIFGVIAVVVYFATDKNPLAPLGVGLAAVISLVLMVFSLSSHWEGQVVEVRTERVRRRDDDGISWEEVEYAYIRQPSGKVRKMRAMPDWQVGDRLEKRKGEAWVRKV